MKDLKEKIDMALNECRILVLVAQVLLGFQFQAVFQHGFEKLPRSSQYLELAGLGLLLIALGLLLAPAAYHRIVERGNLSDAFQRFITQMAEPALLPFALGLSFSIYIISTKVLNRAFGIAFGILSLLTALFFWYGLEMYVEYREGAGKKKAGHQETGMAEQSTPLADKIKFVMTEVRVVLPGTQALLGFQFAAVLNRGFDQLAPTPRDLHLVSLAWIALSSIFLMAPAAYHRIVEKGEDTERLHTFASRMLLAAMACLAIGISGDVAVVVYAVLHSRVWAISTACLTLVGFFGLWFGYSLYRRAEVQSTQRQPATHLAP